MHEIPEETIEKLAEFSIEGRVYHGERIERWVITDRGGEASCGDNVPIVIETTVGVSETEEATLKRYCEFSLGIKDVRLFKAGLEDSLRSSISWSAGEKTTITVQLIAPRCGSFHYSVYRKVCIYRLRTFKRRLFRKPFQIDLPEFTELTRNYIARVTEERDHPACPCTDPVLSGLPVRVRLMFGEKFAAFVDGVIDSARRLKFKLGDQEYDVDALAVLQGEVSERIADVPSFFVDLADMAEASEIEVMLSATLDGDAGGLLLSLLSGWLTDAGQTPLPT